MKNEDRPLTKEEKICIYFVFFVVLFAMSISISLVYDGINSNKSYKKEKINSDIKPSTTIQTEKKWIPSLFEAIDFIGKETLTYKYLNDEKNISITAGKPEELKDINLDKEIESGVSTSLSEDKKWINLSLDTRKVTFSTPSSLRIVNKPYNIYNSGITPITEIEYTRNAIININYTFLDYFFENSSKDFDYLAEIKDNLIKKLLANGFKSTFRTKEDKIRFFITGNSYFDAGTYYKDDVIVYYYKSGGGHLSISVKSKFKNELVEENELNDREKIDKILSENPLAEKKQIRTNPKNIDNFFKTN